MHWLTACLVFTSWAIPFKWLDASEQFSEKDIAYFERRIRPMLVEHCYECHSAASVEVKGELRLDSRPAMLSGGESGPTMIPGKPKQSLLILALKHESLEMPPGKSSPRESSVISMNGSSVAPRTREIRQRNLERSPGNFSR